MLVTLNFLNASFVGYSYIPFFHMHVTYTDVFVLFWASTPRKTIVSVIGDHHLPQSHRLGLSFADLGLGVADEA